MLECRWVSLNYCYLFTIHLMKFREGIFSCHSFSIWATYSLIARPLVWNTSLFPRPHVTRLPWIFVRLWQKKSRHSSCFQLLTCCKSQDNRFIFPAFWFLIRSPRETSLVVLLAEDGRCLLWPPSSPCRCYRALHNRDGAAASSCRPQNPWSISLDYQVGVSKAAWEAVLGTLFPQGEDPQRGSPAPVLFPAGHGFWTREEDHMEVNCLGSSDILLYTIFLPHVPPVWRILT